MLTGGGNLDVLSFLVLDDFGGGACEPVNVCSQIREGSGRSDPHSVAALDAAGTATWELVDAWIALR